MTAPNVLGPDASRRVLDLLVAMMHADDEVAEPELRVAEGARLALGLVTPADRIESELLRGPRGVWTRLAHHDARTRTIAYCCATFMALADARIDAREHRFLRSLQDELGIPPAHVGLANGVARWVHSLGLPAHRAFDRLVLECARRYLSLRAHVSAA